MQDFLSRLTNLESKVEYFIACFQIASVQNHGGNFGVFKITVSVQILLATCQHWHPVMHLIIVRCGLAEPLMWLSELLLPLPLLQIIIIPVSCGRPITPDNGSIETYQSTTEGAMKTLRLSL